MTPHESLIMGELEHRVVRSSLPSIRVADVAEERLVQFYLDGFRPGDPFVQQPHLSAAGRTTELPETADVVIIGCGPAGLVLAAQLASSPTFTPWSWTGGMGLWRSAKPTASPAAPWRCSRHSASLTS